MRQCRSLLLILVFAMYLGLSNGYLAIFSGKDNTPIQVLPYHESVFTQQERRQLATGIPFTSVAERSRLLEDFTS